MDRVGTEWIPIHHVVRWCDGSSRDRMTVMVLMPTGVDENFTCRVVENGAELEITMEWPRAIYNVDDMHKQLYTELETKEDYGDFLLKKAAISKAVKKIMKEKDDRMVSKCRIQLPMISNGESEPHLLPQNDGSLIFYADLRCETKESNTVISGRGLLKRSPSPGRVVKSSRSK